MLMTAAAGYQGEGTLKVSDEVIAVCAANAALKTEGVSSLFEGISDVISRNILRKETASKGIRVTQTEDGTAIDVHITVKYNTKIPAVAWELQENVKKEVQLMTEVKVAAVNIHVEGVEIPSEEEHRDEQE